MNFSQFLAILRARWMTATVVFLVMVSLVVGVSMLMPAKYKATAAVLVDMRSNDPIAGLSSANGLPMSYVSTQADIITSPRVAQRVVRDLKLTESPQLRSQWTSSTDGEGSFEVWLADALKTELDVKPSRESSVINVSFTSPDPKFSAALANAFVQAYLDTTLDLRVDPAKQYSSFFDSRSKELRDALEKAQAKLSTYQRDHGILGNDERYDVETARLNELSSQLVAVQAITAESSSRDAQARKGSSLGEVINNPVVQGLRTELSRQEAKFKEMNVRMGDNHPQVVEARASIGELRDRIATESRRVSGSVSTDNTINQSREGELRGAMATQRARVAQMKQQRDEAMVLQRDVESAQRAYEAVAARFTQTSLESQTKLTNTALLAAATPPIRPASPNLALNSLLGVFVGVMFAVAFALLRELRDRRLRSVQDAIQVLGLPVIGHLPGPMRKPLLGRERLVLPQQVMAKLPRGRKAQTEPVANRQAGAQP
ncbi:MAG: chain length determinant protein EpsF [Rhizobacter sp.]